MEVLALLLVLFFSNDVFCVNIRVDPLVLTKQGLVRGQKATDGDYSMFLGIPYARIDLTNPFGSNLPPENYLEIFNAYDGSMKCPQSESIWGQMRQEGSLDCLRLNIYVPSIANSKNQLPVMVWIHGGKYAGGSAAQYHARDLVRHDIILVTINYRLGAYGFMCLDVPTVPGNQGLRDQMSALEWIKENIGVFGGDSNSITIAGQSAGAASVEFQLFSSYEKLYHKAIIQSGSSQSDEMFVEADEGAAIKIAEHLGFGTDDTNQALNFLSTASPSLVTGAASELNLNLMPCKERSFSGLKNFIDCDPFSLSAPAKLLNLPILIGHTEKETLEELVDIKEDIEGMGDIFYNKIKDKFNLEEEEIIEAADIIRHFYIGDKTISNEILPEIEAFYSDCFLNHPIQNSITKYLQQGSSPIFEYVFNYIGRSKFDNITGVGASHSEELQYLFATDSDIPFSQEDQIIADRITTLWANFIKYGNPTPEETELLPLKWEPVTNIDRPYMVIDTDIRIEKRIYNNRIAFWDLFYIIYGNHHKLIPECNDE